MKTDEVTNLLNGVQSAEIQANLLAELLTGAATHASTDKSLSVLNGVMLNATGGHMIAKATDRYRLIEGNLTSGVTGELFSTFISLDDIKKLISFAKENKNMPITLSKVNDLLSVSVLGNSITIRTDLTGGNFPDFSKFTGKPKVIERQDSLTINPTYFADLAKIAGKGKSVTIYLGAQALKPVYCEINSDPISWISVIMPMKASN